MLELALTPIPGDSPTGKPARDEAEFEALKAEIDKISGVSAVAVDWARVLTLSSDILERKSKDLLVLSYGILASFETGGFAALSDGLEAAQKLVSIWWDGLFPERPRARVAAFEWLVQRGSASVMRRDPGADESAAVEAALMRLGELEALLQEKLGPAAPGLGELKGALREKLEAVAQPAAAAVASTGFAAATAAAPASHDLASEEGRDEALRESMVALRALATAMRGADARDPRAYKLMRVGAWARLRELPPNENGLTRIPPAGVSPEFLSSLDAQGGRGEWGQVIEQAEGRFSECILWLDLQLHVTKGMAAMGSSFDRAREVVLHECRGLLRTLPGLAELQYADGSPLAGDETRRWLVDEVLTSGSGDAGVVQRPGVPASEAAGEAQERIAEARNLAQAGKAAAAIQLLSAAAQAAGLRGKIALRIEIANILAGAKEPRLAVAQMQLLDEELRRSPFEQWDPPTGILFLQYYLRHQRALARTEGESSPEARKADELYARLSRLDAAAALSMRP
jgi:type VI secretion system protein VasJ